MAFERIQVDPRKMGGVPIIRDLRMPVATIVNMVADGRICDAKTIMLLQYAALHLWRGA